MTRAQQLEWLLTMLATLGEPDFYGEVRIQFNGGQVTTLYATRSHKPAPLSHKQMTSQEYKIHQDLQRTLGEMTHG